jgi:hypothetical protein
MPDGRTGAYKVERGDGENETFKRSVFSSVPDSLRVPWGLDSVQLLYVLDAESQEIDSLFISSILFTGMSNGPLRQHQSQLAKHSFPVPTW